MIRVAQLVYDCIPNAGSDPGIGWHAVISASGAGFDVQAITRASNRQAIEAVAPLPNVTWHFLDVPERIGPLRTGRTVGDTVHLTRWLRAARTLCQKLADDDAIDLTHFVTFTAFWMPVPLNDVPVPHVFGPVGGGERVPKVLATTYRDRFSARARHLFQETLTRTSTWKQLVMATKTTVLSSSDATTRRLEARGIRVFETWRTGCITNELITQLDEIEPQRESGTVIVVSGRQLRWKGHDLAIAALQYVLPQYPDAQLDVIGSGPEHTRLLAQVDKMGLAAHVRFRPEITREEERRRIAGADCFLLPSRRDAGSTLLPLVQILQVPIAGFAIGAIPAATGGFAHLAEPEAKNSPEENLADAICLALSSPKKNLEKARRSAIERYGEPSAQDALARWYAYALAPR